MLLHLAVAVHPVHIVAQVEGPDGGVLVVLPAGCDGGGCLAVAVEAQQTVPAVGDDVQVGSGLAVQEVPGLQLTVGSLEGDVIGDGVGCGAAAPEAAPEVLAAVLLEEPPQAARMLAAPTTPEALRKLRRLME